LQVEKINGVGTSDLARSRRGLERKAAEYEKLKRGWTDELTPEQKEEILVDFEAKYLDLLSEEEEEEEELDIDLEEPSEEVTDEFGRTRKVRRTRVRRPLPPPEKRPYSRGIFMLI
jgi:coiled-coil domain-containing protein 174